MLEILPAPAHVVAFKVIGKLETADYRRVFAELEERLRTHERLGLYVDASELRGISARALFEDLKYTVGKLGEYHRFPRAALVGDQGWLRGLARLGGVLVPGVDLRTFGSAERDAALSWISSLEDRPREPALRLIPTTRADTVAFAWNGTASSTEMAEIVAALERALDQHERIRVFGRIERLGVIPPGAFSASGLLRVKRRARNKVERYAVVGGPKWLKRWIGLMSKLFGLDIRHLEASEEAAAWAWLEAQPATTDGGVQPGGVLHA